MCRPAVAIPQGGIFLLYIWSAVSLDCDRKFRNFWGSTKAVRQLSDTLCVQNGLPIIENPQPPEKGKTYKEWLGNQAKPSHRALIRAAIDDALLKKPTTSTHCFKRCAMPDAR